MYLEMARDVGLIAEDIVVSSSSSFDDLLALRDPDVRQITK